MDRTRERYISTFNTMPVVKKVDSIRRQYTTGIAAAKTAIEAKINEHIYEAGTHYLRWYKDSIQDGF